MIRQMPAMIPAPFAPLEYLVGEWKGQAIPKENAAQQFRGWTEKHAWAWTFTKGKPTGLSFTIKDGKVLASGKLSFDPQKELYRLEGKEPGARGKVIAFEGKLDSSGKQLVLDQTHEESDPPPADGQLRISLRPNANFLRYTMMHDRKPPGAAVFTRTTEVGVTKEGEAFAAGASRDRASQVHRDRRRGDDDSVVRRQVVPAVLLGLPRRIQRQPPEIRQESRTDAGESVGEVVVGLRNHEETRPRRRLRRRRRRKQRASPPRSQSEENRRTRAQARLPNPMKRKTTPQTQQNPRTKPSRRRKSKRTPERPLLQRQRPCCAWAAPSNALARPSKR